MLDRPVADGAVNGEALVSDSASVTRRIALNNFDALRLFAALLVILGHGQDAKGFIPTILWNFPISRIGLDIFFSISGYLVCDSWLRTPRLGVFLAKRALRIFPALFVCVALTALVLGPMTTVLPLWKYFGHHQTWSYFLNDVLYLRLNLPGVFTGRHLGGAVNGSLWSLFPEVLCYPVIPLMWLAPRFGRIPLLLAIMAGCGFLGLWLFDHLDRQIGLVYSADPKYMLVQVPFFMAGAVLRLVAVRFPGMFRLDIACVCAGSNFYLPQLLGTGSVPYEWLTLAYLVVALGLYSTPVLNRAARFGDLSYGMYLYAFPLQQVVLDHGPGWGIVRCTLASVAAAFFSWHLVEAPALRLKPRGEWPARAGPATASLHRFAGLVSRPARVPFSRDNAGSSILWLATIVCVALVIQSLVAIWRFHDTLPFYDMILVDYQYLFGTARSFWLFADNEHRPLVAMPLYWLDLRVFHDQEGVLVLCNVIVAMGIAAMPFAAVGRAVRNRALRVASCALLTALMFWLANRENLSWPKQIHMYLSVLLLMLAFRRVAADRRVGAGAGACIAAWLALSTFSFGFGMIGFPATLIVAGLRRWAWRPVAVVVAVFAACIALYAGLTDGFSFLRPSEGAPPLAVAQTLLFALTFLAAPIVMIVRAFGLGGLAIPVAQGATVLALALFAWRTLRCLRHRPAELETWALLLAAFAVGNALQTALARAAVHGIDYALEYRYIMGELPFWSGVILLVIPAMAKVSRAWLALGAWGWVAVAAALLVSQQTELDNHRWENAFHWQEAMSALTGVPDRALYDERIWENSDQVIAVLDGLRQRHYSMFAWRQAGWMGHPISDFQLAKRTCMGELRGSFPVKDGGGSLVLGWSGDPAVPDWDSWIVLANESGVITGLARGGLKDGSARYFTGSSYSAWRGYARGSAAHIIPYLVLPGDRLCRIAAPA